MAVLALAGCSPSPGTPDAGPTMLTREAMLDPASCQQCHTQHYNEWLVSTHAHASDDPVFVAMNARGQRETDGGLGTTCVSCHAPMAVRDHKTTDGLNLASLPPQYQGITCFFCHSIDSVDEAHPYNANVDLADADIALRGEISDPKPGPHASRYSSLHDGNNLDSAKLCGNCHDIVVPAGGHVERTYAEWRDSAYNASAAAGGSTCAQCHMRQYGFQPIATGGPSRPYHPHDFPAVDVDVRPGHPTAQDEAAVKDRLNEGAVRGALCVTQAGGIRVVLDPFGIGHGWPSGAAQDRRAWAEVVAYRGGQVIYSSGLVPDGTAVGDEPERDPADLWVLKDTMFDAKCNTVDMFWQAVDAGGSELLPASTFDSTKPEFYANHTERRFPHDGTPLSQVAGIGQAPDRVTLRVRLQPIALDVLGDLVDSGDLDGGVVQAMPTFNVSLVGPVGPDAGPNGISVLEWTAANAGGDGGPTPFMDPIDGTEATCVGAGYFVPQPAYPARAAPVCVP